MADEKKEKTQGEPEAPIAGEPLALAPAPEVELPKTVPWEQYQALQRKHDRVQKRNRELAARDTSRSTAHLEEQVGQLIEVLGSGNVVDKGQLDAIKERGATLKAQEERVTLNQGRIAELLEDYEGNWNEDEQFAEAREAWQGFRLEEAVQLTRAALRGSTTNPQEMKSQVAAEVQKIAKEKGWVDTGGSTGGGRKLSRREDWDNIVPGSAEEDEALAATLAAIKAQRR